MHYTVPSFLPLDKIRTGRFHWSLRWCERTQVSGKWIFLLTCETKNCITRRIEMASTRFLAEYVYLASYEYFQNNLEGEFFFVFFYSVFLDYTRLKNVKVWIKAAASYVQRNWICQVMYVSDEPCTVVSSFIFLDLSIMQLTRWKPMMNDGIRLEKLLTCEVVPLRIQPYTCALTTHYRLWDYNRMHGKW